MTNDPNQSELSVEAGAEAATEAAAATPKSSGAKKTTETKTSTPRKRSTPTKAKTEGESAVEAKPVRTRKPKAAAVAGETVTTEPKPPARRVTKPKAEAVVAVAETEKAAVKPKRVSRAKPKVEVPAPISAAPVTLDPASLASNTRAPTADQAPSDAVVQEPAVSVFEAGHEAAAIPVIEAVSEETPPKPEPLEPRVTGMEKPIREAPAYFEAPKKKGFFSQLLSKLFGRR